MTVADAIIAQRFISIVRSKDRQTASAIIDGQFSAGVKVLEVSLVTPDALDLIAQAVSRGADGVFIGVGTALSVSDVASAAEAGATFVVSPNLDVNVLRATLDRGMVSLPGVATPTEAILAKSYGAEFQKLFPASLWTPRSMRDLLVAIPDLSLVPTGGIDAGSAADWIRDGAVAVGLGSAVQGMTSQDTALKVRDVREALASLG